MMEPHEYYKNWQLPQASMLESQIASVAQGILVVTSTFFAGFYVLQWLRGKCAPEAIYTSIVTMIIYSSSLLAGPVLTWVTIEGGLQVPLGRYFSWMLTCPVILMQFIKLYKSVGQELSPEIENFIIIVDQIMIVTGAFGAVSQGFIKWIFFCIAFCAGAGLFSSMWVLTSENIKKFPVKGRFPLKIAASLFFLSWASFPALWLLGSPGFNYITVGTDIALHCLADFVSKNLFSFAAWYVRWNCIGDSNEVTRYTSKREAFNAHLKQNLQGQNALTDEDMAIARKKSFNLLLLCSDPVVFKLMSLMMERIGVEMMCAPDVLTAKTLLGMSAMNHFDAVVVAPGRCSLNDVSQLEKISGFISSPPYKLPLLAVFFDGEEKKNDPGSFIHGIIHRPLDESSFESALLEWRLTTLMWRRVATSVEAIEGFNRNTAPPNSRPGTPSHASGSINTSNDAERKKFGSQMMPTFMQEPIVPQHQQFAPPTNTFVNPMQQNNANVQRPSTASSTANANTQPSSMQPPFRPNQSGNKNVHFGN